MEAIILVGGLGTRLGNLTKQTPKPMLPIRGVPFLERFLIDLKSKGVEKVTLAVGYKKQVVENYFKSGGGDLLPEINYSVEDIPLGTGGAIAHALEKVSSDDVFVLNGDSYLDLDFHAMEKAHKDSESDITISSYYMEHADRYGIMEVDGNKILKFKEKGYSNDGLINGGVYLLNVKKFRNLFSFFDKKKFSFEKEILTSYKKPLEKFHFQVKGVFLDIGVPRDYRKAQLVLFL